MKDTKAQKMSDARKKMFVQLLATKNDQKMTRVYMAMKSSAMLNLKKSATE